jgi:hypothetical protein
MTQWVTMRDEKETWSKTTTPTVTTQRKFQPLNARLIHWQV